MTGQHRFVILSTQRSGSNWVEDRLTGHPGIIVRRGEIFRKTLRSGDAYIDYRSESGPQRALGTIAPGPSKARFLWDVAAQADPSAFGFRLMYDQLRRNPSLLVTLRLQRYRIIHLVRNNVLETHISVARAKHSGLFVTRSDVKRPDPVELPVDGLVDALDRRVRLIERHRRICRLFPSLEVEYEQYVADPADVDRSVMQHIGVDPAVELESTLSRLSVPSLGDKVTNPGQVVDALGGTPFEHLATELG